MGGSSYSTLKFDTRPAPRLPSKPPLLLSDLCGNPSLRPRLTPRPFPKSSSRRLASSRRKRGHRPFNSPGRARAGIGSRVFHRLLTGGSCDTPSCDRPHIPRSPRCVRIERPPASRTGTSPARTARGGHQGGDPRHRHEGHDPERHDRAPRRQDCGARRQRRRARRRGGGRRYRQVRLARHHRRPLAHRQRLDQRGRDDRELDDGNRGRAQFRRIGASSWTWRAALPRPTCCTAARTRLAARTR